MPAVTAVNINDEFAIRIRKLAELRQEGIEPYPARAARRQMIGEALNLAPGESVAVAGRVLTKREMGKLTFCHLQDESGRMQIVLKKDEMDAESYNRFVKKIDPADIVDVAGVRFVTQKGEESILVKDWGLLTKALLPLPEKWHGLTDVEARYRKRYLDLLANPGSMRIAILRSNLVRALRHYFDVRGFYEVETPVLQTLYGGALAKPFVTHHNALDIPLYLRIAPELYLKRLIVGGFEKVYEVSK